MTHEYTWIKVQKLKRIQPKKRFQDIWNKILKDSFRLDQILAVHRGLWTGALYVFIVPADIVEEHNLEKDALKPAIRGRDIKPFGYIWRGFYIIYASKKHIPDFDERFPNVMKWLSKHRLILERRSTVFTWGRNWWELEDPLDPSVFEQPKILSPLFARQQSFALDTKNHYVLDSTTIIRPWLNSNEHLAYAENWRRINDPDIDIDEFVSRRKEFESVFSSIVDELLYILGLLNSEVLEFFFKQYTPMLTKRTKRPKKGRWFSYMPPYLNVLPLRLGTRDQIQEIISLSSKLTHVTTQFLAEENDQTKLELESEIGLLVHKLNETVFDIYDIDEKERIVIQNYVYQKR